MFHIFSWIFSVSPYLFIDISSITRFSWWQTALYQLFFVAQTISFCCLPPICSPTPSICWLTLAQHPWLRLLFFQVYDGTIFHLKAVLLRVCWTLFFTYVFHLTSVFLFLMFEHSLWPFWPLRFRYLFWLRGPLIHPLLFLSSISHVG